MVSFLRALIPEKPSSSVGFEKYPTLRDHPLHTPELWLEGKRADDAAEGLWRINNSLYDLEAFVGKHPGGEDWINLSKGTDITEAFECHHISLLPATMLKTYYVREATEPRNVPFTLKEDGFYKTIKRNVREELKNIDYAPESKTNLMTDALLITYLSLALAAARWQSFALAIPTGIVLCLTANAAHNFFHKKDNFRMYYFDFSLLSSKGWRVSHVLSHHIYTNTVYDMEIAMLEPWFQYLPVRKHFIYKYISWLYSPIIYVLSFPITSFRGILQVIMDGGKSFQLASLLPVLVLIAMNMVSPGGFLQTSLIYTSIIAVAGFLFSFIGLNAAHHHPDIFHDGDKPLKEKGELDWGEHVLDSVMDKTELMGNDFLVLTNFGDHCLHHLFPTLDQGVLKHLYPVLQKTCKEFGLEHKIISQMEMTVGQYKQLAKDTGRK